MKQKDVTVVVRLEGGLIDEIRVFKSFKQAERYYARMARKTCKTLAEYQDLLGLGCLRTEYHLRSAQVR